MGDVPGDARTALFRIDVVEMLDGLMPGADRDLVRVWDKMNGKRFDRVMLKTRTVKVEALKEGIKVWFVSNIY